MLGFGLWEVTGVALHMQEGQESLEREREGVSPASPRPGSDLLELSLAAVRETLLVVSFQLGFELEAG